MIPVWKKIPFLRLLPQLIAGIACGWYFHLHWQFAICVAAAAAVFIILHQLTGLSKNFFGGWLPGVGSSLFCIALGILLVSIKQLHFQPGWFGCHYKANDIVQVRLLEPLIEKEKSFKALAEFQTIIHNGKATVVSGKLMLYFKKDSTAPPLRYGSIIATNKSVQEIKNAGNPGGFDYKRYALFNGITHQLFLKKEDYVVVPRVQQSAFYKWLFHTKNYVLYVLRHYIKDSSAISVAEALLIGYRDDLDRDLVQAYSNTGVVHVIAISGLHLGLIYWLLLLLLKPLDRKKQFKWMKPLVAVSLLWVFSLLTGAGASVIRAAMMFSFLAIGDALGKKGNVYNSMAASAFIILLWNPFLLWDVGFQLSYAAVLSIVLFMKPVYNWFTPQNKILDKAWQLSAVTLSAQILTLPLCIYHFHQVPNLFLITNFVAVPLSSFILFGEILLVAVSFMPPVASAVGFVLTYLLQWMNAFITRIDDFSFSVTDGIQHSPWQTIILYLLIIAGTAWLLQKISRALLWCLIFCALFFLLQNFYLYRANTQQKLIVYNISQHAAADIMIGNKYLFIGDSILLKDGFLKNFHLNPSRIFYHTYHHPLQPDLLQNQVLKINGKRILFLNRKYRFEEMTAKISADFVVISKNPRLYMDDLLKTITPGLIIFDSSNPQWKVNLWKKDCERLHINCFSTSEQGAFVMSL